MIEFSNEESSIINSLKIHYATQKRGVLTQTLRKDTQDIPIDILQESIDKLISLNIIKEINNHISFTDFGYQLFFKDPENHEKKEVKMESSIDKKRALRFQVLEALYKSTDGSENKHLSIFQLGDQIGIDRETVEDVFSYLQGEGLAEYVAIGGIIHLTHFGIVQYENAVSNPNEKTEYFPPINQITNILNIHGNVTSSAIQQGSDNLSQNQALSSESAIALKEWLASVEIKLAELKLSAEKQTELLQEIEIVKAILSTSKPKKTFLQSSIEIIKNILANALGAIIAAGLLQKLPII